MKKVSLFTLVCYASYLGLSSEVLAQNKAKVIGFGGNETAALSDAKGKALAKVCGETIVGTTKIQSETEKKISMNSSGKSSKSLDSKTKTDDANETIVSGVIRSFKVLGGGMEGSNHFVEIEAVVGDCPSAESTQLTQSNRQMVEELKALSKNMSAQGMSGGLITKPKNLAEKIYNARVLKSRGEVDRALKAYEIVLKEKLIYVDILEEFVRTSRRVNGVSGTKEYIETALPHLKGKPEYLYMTLMLEDRVNLDAWTSVKENVSKFPPLVPLYLESERSKCLDLATKSTNDVMSCNSSLYSLPNLSAVSAVVQKSIETGEFETYYLNKDGADYFRGSFESVWGQKAISQQQRLTKRLEKLGVDFDKLEALSEDETMTRGEKTKAFIDSNPELMKQFWKEQGIDPSKMVDEAVRKGSHPRSSEGTPKISGNSQDVGSQPGERRNPEGAASVEVRDFKSTENPNDQKDKDPVVEGIKSLTDGIRSLLPFK